jgi:4-hydroxythreonine-4-phosphate dehydrogenase
MNKLHSELPPIVLTSGETAGIGPDLCIQIAQQDWAADLTVIADPRVLEARAARLNLPLEIVSYAQHRPAERHRAGRLQVLAQSFPHPQCCGRLDTANAESVLAMLRRATEGCLSGEFAAMVTAPVHKGIINDAGIGFSGHTELLADITGASQPVMLLATENLRVALATTHLPLATVPAAITEARLTAVVGVLARDLTRLFGIENPRILILGLNPHAGEGGHLGREEVEIIAPTIAALQAQGLDLVGPLPADTAFNRNQLAGTDAALAMYHDQGLPVLKYAGFGRAVNITLGLPIVRTSVDHGTALALAGTGQADSGSLAMALSTAIDMAARARG